MMKLDIQMFAIEGTGKSKRESMKDQIITWQKNIPMIRANLFGAIQRNIKEWKVDKN